MLLVSLINYNSGPDSNKVLKWILNSKIDIPITIIIRDHSPKSQKNTILKDITRENVIFIKSDNLGFAKGHNNSIKSVDYKNYSHILIANVDIYEKTTNLINKLLLESINRNAIIAPTIYSTDTNQVWFSGGKISKITGDLKIDIKQDSIIHETDFITGCFFIIPMSAYLSTKGFNEKYFMYAEDLDLSIKLKKKNFKLYISPGSIFHKVGSGKHGTYSNLYLYEGTKNRLDVLKSHKLGIYPISLIFFYLKYVIARSFQLMLFSKNPINQIKVVFSSVL